jgi:hypothetical protein
MKKKGCAILGARASAVRSQTPRRDPRARQAMIENRSYVIYALGALIHVVVWLLGSLNPHNDV